MEPFKGFTPILNSIFKKYICPLLAVICFVAAALSHRPLAENTPKASEIHYGQTVQKKVLESLETSDKELTEVTGLFQKSQNVKFSELKLNTEYPYFIYENGELIYWSDHRYIPEYSWIKDINDCGLLSQNNHISLAKKQVFYYQAKKLELISIIPIYQKIRNENDYLKSEFHKGIFPTSPLAIENTAGPAAYLNMHDAQQHFLFSIIPPRIENLNAPILSDTTLWLAILGIIFLGIFLFFFVINLAKNNAFEISVLIILAFFVSVRWFMLHNSLPFAINHLDLFNPKFFAINQSSPSLGDLLINTFFFALLLSFITFFYPKSNLYRFILTSSKVLKSFISVLMVIVSNFITYLTSNLLSSLYEKSSYVLDYSFSTSFSELKLATILFVILLAIVFFLVQHILLSIFLRLNFERKSGLFHWLYGLLLSTFVLIYFGENWWIYLLVSGYFFISYYFKLPRFLQSFKYNTSIYFFFGALIYSLLSVKVVQNESIKKSVFDKQNFGLRYLAENDALGEGLLTKVISGIESDSSIQNSIHRELLPKQAVANLVKEKHLDIYFDKYNTEILSFDSKGNQLNIIKDQGSLSDYEKKYKRKKYQTDNNKVFFVNETGDQFIKQYIVFVPLEGNNGTVLLDLRLKDDNAESVYPELLMEKKFVPNPDSKKYSYAIFNQQNQLIYSFGKFNYLKFLNTNILKKPALFQNGVRFNDFEHQGVRSQNGRQIIISSESQVWKSLLSDFSFLYLILVLIISLIILLYALRIGFKSVKMNFSTKIQIYLNAAFLLPFLLILFAIIGVIRSTLLNIQGNFYLENTKNISSTIRLHLQNLEDGKFSPAFFKQEVDKLAQDTKADITLFDLNGKLAYSSRPLIYDYHLLSERINPKAFQGIIEEHENEILVDESLGKLKYKAAYLIIKGNDNKRLGVIGIPFFDSSSTLEMQLKEVFTTILSICIALFLILLVLSYFASGSLTHPLKMVAQKIKKTSLNRQNEPIIWEANDEIGVLTKSYNNMVKMLEESKDALSQSEKQTAWREMAKQVAHEIKNPLTPMKLSIQQLQRTLPSLDEPSQKRIERALGSLTEQIDNISEIANSFSEFAKMPVPRSEVFELSNLVQRSAYLYAQNNNINLSIEADEKDLYVKSDHNLINRVVTNLILNGIQSVPEERKAEIKVKVYKNDKDKFAIIEVKDNGSGIPEHVRTKVFIPNFSTKIGGSGLGLAMAKRGVEHSGGNIWFETEIGIGTTFYVDLPLANKA
jgi:two-component system, NtrC family, nitrogen regulation sensor histidine kinase NtrY